MDLDRRRFLATTMALATSGLGLSAASGVVSSGGYELVPTEFESQEVLKARPVEPEPAPRRNYLCEARDLGLQVCPPRPVGADLHPSACGDEPHYAYWSCCFSDDVFVSRQASEDACFDSHGLFRRLEDATLAAWDQWRRWISEPSSQEATRPHRYVTTPTVVHYGVAEGQHFYAYFHVSRGDLRPTTPQEYLSSATWLASRIVRLPTAEQQFILAKVRGNDEILHSMVKTVLHGWREVALGVRDSVATMINVPQPIDHIDLHLTI